MMLYINQLIIKLKLKISRLYKATFFNPNFIAPKAFSSLALPRDPGLDLWTTGPALDAPARGPDMKLIIMHGIILDILHNLL